MKKHIPFLAFWCLFSGISCSFNKECPMAIVVMGDEYDTFDCEKYEFDGQTDLGTLTKIFGGSDIITSSQQVIWDNCSEMNCIKNYWDSVQSEFSMYFESRYGLAFQMPSECGNQLIFAIENGLLISPNIGVDYLNRNESMRKFFFESAESNCFGRVDCNSYSNEIHYLCLIGEKLLNSRRNLKSNKQLYTSHFIRKIFCIQKKYLLTKLDNGQIDENCYKQASSIISKKRKEFLQMINYETDEISINIFRLIERVAGVPSGVGFDD